MAKTLSLRELLEEYKRKRGFQRLLYMEQLRQYVRETHWRTVLDEIRQVWDREDLNILIGVGMKGALYYATLGQKAQAEGLI